MILLIIIQVIILLILLVLLYYITNRYFINKIPHTIYQTFSTKNLPDEINNVVIQIKNRNPEFEHIIYDDDDMRNFIVDNFDEEVVNAYDSIIPGAFRADLWRYCILYKKGGIYLDIKYKPVNNFKFKTLLDTGNEYFVRDLDQSESGVYNAFIIVKPNNPILKEAINKVVYNVKNKFYGNSDLEPTGPRLLKKIFKEEEINNLPLYLSKNDNKLSIFHSKIDQPILEIDYNAYKKQKEINTHYSILWSNRKLYKS